MSDRRKRDFMDNLDKCYNVVQQSSAKGASAIEVAKKLGIHRTTVHSYLNTLEYMGKVRSEHGLWYAKEGEQGIKPLETEIVIELPIPKDSALPIAALDAIAKQMESTGLAESADTVKTLLEKIKETRTIKIRCKNVDDLDLEKLQTLVLQAYENSSKIKLKSQLKRIFGGKHGSGF
jgi:hypothetical protein